MSTPTRFELARAEPIGFQLELPLLPLGHDVGPSSEQSKKSRMTTAEGIETLGSAIRRVAIAQCWAPRLIVGPDCFPLQLPNTKLNF